MEFRYISDLHFAHNNVILFDKRPWFTLEEMEEGIVENWNNAVYGKTTTFILGDFYWGKNVEDCARILQRLKGEKVLIRGNHDPRLGSDFYKQVNLIAKNRGFKDVLDYAIVKDGLFECVLSHFPMLAYVHDYKSSVYMLHGHVHDTKEAHNVDVCVNFIQSQYIPGSHDNRGQIINVGACRPYMNYAPQTLEYLVEHGMGYIDNERKDFNTNSNKKE